MKFIHVIAGSEEEFRAWRAVQPPLTDDGERIRYVYVVSTDNVRSLRHPHFYFLKGWRRHPQARALYNRALKAPHGALQAPGHIWRAP